jgi:hypothetical protein
MLVVLQRQRFTRKRPASVNPGGPSFQHVRNGKQLGLLILAPVIVAPLTRRIGMTAPVIERAGAVSHSGCWIPTLDDWLAEQREPDLTRSEAIRRLVDLGLKAKK